MWLRPINHASNGLDVQVNAKNMYINSQVGPPIMPKGLKQTSATINIGYSATESAANTYTQISVDLNLDPLNREVFIVQGIDMDLTPPDVVAGTSTLVEAALTTTSQTDMVRLSNANCLSSARSDIRMGAGSVEGVPFTRDSSDVIPASLEYLGIIATNDFFVSVKGANNTAAKSVSGKVYGYRAQASADIYAALVQSEVLSA